MHDRPAFRKAMMSPTRKITASIRAGLRTRLSSHMVGTSSVTRSECFFLTMPTSNFVYRYSFDYKAPAKLPKRGTAVCTLKGIIKWTDIVLGQSCYAATTNIKLSPRLNSFLVGLIAWHEYNSRFCQTAGHRINTEGSAASRGFTSTPFFNRAPKTLICRVKACEDTGLHQRRREDGIVNSNYCQWSERCFILQAGIWVQRRGLQKYPYTRAAPVGGYVLAI